MLQEKQHEILSVQSAFLHVLSLSVWTEGCTCKIQRVETTFTLQLSHMLVSPFMKLHLIPLDTGSAVEVCTEVCTEACPREEVRQDLSVVFYCV